MMRSLLGPTRLVRSHADDRATRRAVERGELVRLARGCHIEATSWSAADRDEQFRLRIHAARDVTRGAFVLSHAAAAFAWGLPWIGAWPSLVDMTDPRRANSRSGQLVRVHSVALEVADIVEREGFVLTSPARTAVDLALSVPPMTAVAAVDGAMHAGSASREELAAVLARRSGSRRLPSARSVISFADAGADSAAESASRVTIHSLGAPEPQLQRRFRNSMGPNAFADFWWEGAGAVGECDGDGKYLRPRFRQGRSVEQALLEEKRRADWLQSQAEVHRLVRWGWEEAVSAERMRPRLIGAGVSLGRRRRFADPW